MGRGGSQPRSQGFLSFLKIRIVAFSPFSPSFLEERRSAGDEVGRKRYKTMGARLFTWFVLNYPLMMLLFGLQSQKTLQRWTNVVDKYFVDIDFNLIRNFVHNDGRSPWRQSSLSTILKLISRSATSSKVVDCVLSLSLSLPYIYRRRCN